MPSTRKQKSREKSSRQSKIMNDIETLDVMLGTISRNEITGQLCENEDNLDRSSNERQTNTNPSGDDFGTPLNTNSIEISDFTSETVRMIKFAITSQVSSKMNEFKGDLNLHTRETVEQVFADQVLPTTRETSGVAK